MTQSYGELFARVYDEYWSGMVQALCPSIFRYLTETAPVRERRLLDLCCGTGQLLGFFCDRGFQAVGIDRSEHMLAQATKNLQAHLAAGRVELRAGDARDFTLPERVACVTSTFDALNGGLSTLDELRACFACVFRCLSDGGAFVFDCISRAGLEQQNHMNLRDMQDTCFFSRIVYDPVAGQALGRVTGFVLEPDGRWRRFEQIERVTSWSSAQVLGALQEAGFTRCWAATLGDLSTPAEDPERLPRIFFVAHRP